MTTNGYTNGVHGTAVEQCSRTYVKLSDKIRSRSSPFFSLEFFPPRTKEGAVNLFAKLNRFRVGVPLFVDITWHAASNVSTEVIAVDSTDSVNVAGVALNYCGLDVILHITCVGQNKESMDALIRRAKKCGITNLLVLRGDKPQDEVDMFFKHPVDLIRYIRSEYGDFFTIAVAGYPSGHPESKSYTDDLLYLKGKVEAGADFVITQLFFEAAAFIKFVKDCRDIDIEVPILPGVLPIQSYESLRQIVKLSKLEIPRCLVDKMIKIKDNDEAIRKFGIELAVKTCKEILDSNAALGIHFFTLNREVAVISILQRLGLWRTTERIEWPVRKSSSDEEHMTAGNQL